MKQSQRSKRLAELIQRSLASSLILRYRDNPYLAQVTITSVEVAADLSVAKVFVDVLDVENVKHVLKELRHEANNLRHALANALNLRITPYLNFVYDAASVRGQKLSLLIDQAIAADEAAYKLRALQEQQEQEDLFKEELLKTESHKEDHNKKHEEK